MEQTQVVIIGAGPTGLSLAAQLLRHNIDFMILEKNEKTTHLSKAVVVQARTLEIFEEIGLAREAIKRGRLTTAMNIYYKGRRKAFLDLAGMGEGISAFPFALSLEQSKTEKLLLEHMEANGKAVQWQSEFVCFEQDAAVTVYYKDANGIGKIIKAEYIVGCDGAGSIVRHQMGASFKGDTLPKLFYVADVTLSSSVINKDELFIFLIKKGFVIFFPMEGVDHYRMIGIIPDYEEGDTITFEAISDAVKEQVKIPIAFEELKWFSTYKVHSRKADFFMKQRCFVAGDAAHIHTPAGGQGMNTGIQDAYNLAWKISCVMNDKADSQLLDTYNIERIENARHLLQTTDRMFDFMAGRGMFSNFIRLNIFPIVAKLISGKSGLNKRFFPLIAQTGIAYPHSPLTIKSAIGKVKAGDRMHYFVLKDGSNIFDHLTAPAFKLLFFGEKKNPDQLKDSKLLIIFLQLTEIPESLFNSNTDFYILLRPDNHISYIGREIEKCRKVIQTILPLTAS
jgi:2-polyprenyl-6-methoxyphenol hydroxylase-like FAD-dependent oxidoreductase